VIDGSAFGVLTNTSEIYGWSGDYVDVDSNEDAIDDDTWNGANDDLIDEDGDGNPHNDEFDDHDGAQV